MQQTLKVILLKQRSEYLLIEGCYEVISEEEIAPFPAFTSQRDVFLTSDTVMSILDPSPKLIELYNSK